MRRIDGLFVRLINSAAIVFQFHRKLSFDGLTFFVYCFFTEQGGAEHIGKTFKALGKVFVIDIKIKTRMLSASPSIVATAFGGNELLIISRIWKLCGT